MAGSEQLALTQADQRQAMKDGELLGWQCQKCDLKSFTPVLICQNCKSRDIQKVELPKEGEVESFTIQKVSIEEFINEVPFAYVVVRLTDGTLVSGWMGDIMRESDVQVGMKVRTEGTYKPGVLFEPA